MRFPMKKSPIFIGYFMDKASIYMKPPIIHNIYAERIIVNHTDKERRHQGLRAAVPLILLPALLVCHKHRRRQGNSGRNHRRPFLYHLEGERETEHLPLRQELPLHRCLERLLASSPATTEGRGAAKEDATIYSYLHFEPGRRSRV